MKKLMLILFLAAVAGLSYYLLHHGAHLFPQKTVETVKQAPKGPVKKCMWCKSGRFRCVVCRGTGYPLITRCPKCRSEITFTYDAKTKITRKFCSGCGREFTDKDGIGKKCGYCDGIGHVVCKNCNGAGTVPLFVVQYDYKTKPVTRGIGSRSNSAPCPQCYGRGYLGVVTCPMCGSSVERKIDSSGTTYYCTHCEYMLSSRSIVCDLCGGSGRIQDRQ